MDQVNQALWKRFLAVAKPYWFSDAKKSALGLLSMLLLLLVAVNGLNVVINYVSGDFMTALSKKDVPTFYHYLYIYGGVFVVGIPIVVMYGFVRQKLGVSWRNWLTNHLLDKYFKNRSYYRINNDPNIDNPDERLAQDVDSFTASALSLLLTILSSIITFFSFIFILYTISIKLMIVLIVYATVGTIVTLWFGKRLVGLNFNQLRREADYRYSVIHVRNNVESIAFYRGEERERQTIRKRFSDAISNYNLLIGWSRNLGFVTTGYDYFVVIIPSLVIAPLYFAGQIEFGVISQADMAFGQVLGALSLVVAEFKLLTSFAAVVNRLAVFNEALDAPEHASTPDATLIETKIGDDIKFNDVTLFTPKYERPLVRNLSTVVDAGSPLVVMGPSGSGKSSLLRALAGLPMWNSGSGSIERPDLDNMLFLPQRPYMILGSLREQLVYPKTDMKVDDKALMEVLALVNLEDLPERVGGFETVLHWADVLSLGEQQRLAFARLLLGRPKYAILDEATSALDAENELRLYGILKNSGTTFVSVGHRPSLIQYHRNVLVLDGKGGWSIVPSNQYTA